MNLFDAAYVGTSRQSYFIRSFFDAAYVGTSRQSYFIRSLFDAAYVGTSRQSYFIRSLSFHLNNLWFIRWCFFMGPPVFAPPTDELHHEKTCLRVSDHF